MRRLAHLFFVSLVSLAQGCGRDTGRWNGVVRAGAARTTPQGDVLSDSALKRYLPATVLGRPGEAPQGSVTRIGSRSLAEATRSYRAPGADLEAEIKLADARYEPRATEAIRSLAGADEPDDDDAAERLVLPGAIGYARFDQGERTAQAQVVIGGRFIASATVQPAKGAEEAVAALRSIDTLAISRLAAQSD